LNGAAIFSGAPLIVQDVRKDARYLTTFSATLAEAIFPIRSIDGTVVGTIDVESDRADAFTPDDERFLILCAEALLGLWA
jgi:putative methionine-R-sulfoxide reductase with GAF domain